MRDHGRAPLRRDRLSAADRRDCDPTRSVTNSQSPTCRRSPRISPAKQMMPATALIRAITQIPRRLDGNRIRPEIAPAHHADAKKSTAIAAIDHRWRCMPMKPASTTAMRTIGRTEFSQNRLLSIGNPFGLSHQYAAAAMKCNANATSTSVRSTNGLLLTCSAPLIVDCYPNTISTNRRSSEFASGVSRQLAMNSSYGTRAIRATYSG